MLGCCVSSLRGARILARAEGQETEYEEMIDAQIVKPNFHCVGGSVAVDAVIS